MFDFQKKFSVPVLVFLFCVALLPQAATAQHASYWCADGRTGDNGTNCGENAWHEDACEKCKPHLIFRVKSWQKCVSNTTQSSDDGYFSYFITGYCNKDCLSYVEQPKYYDDPEKPGIQTQGDNAAKIKLPVVLAWKDVPGFGDNSSTRALCSGRDSDCNHSGPSPVSGNGYGPITYRIQIWDDSASGIDNFNILPNRLNSQPDIGLVSSGIEDGVNGKKAFFAVLSQSGEKSGFNSRTHGGLCFFNSTDTYHWRVKACCDDAGTSCKDYKPNEWWTFTASTAPELYNPLDSDWNGAKSVVESFKDIVPAKEPLKWCAAKLPKEYQIENRPIQYAKSYQLTVTSNEKNDFTDKVLNLWKNVSSWYLQAAGLGTVTAGQSTHALSAINGSLIYNIFPDPTTEEVETWYPAQSRGDLAFFSRNRTYSWTMKSCPDSFAAKCFDDPSQEWKIETPQETIPAPAAITPKNDPTDNEPVAFPISLSWSIPSGANSFRYETDIPNFTGERKTAWNTIPNNEFDDATRKLLGLENVAIKLDTTYKWRVKSCAMFDSGQSNPADCNDWSEWFSFRTAGRPPRKNSMLPSLDPKIEATFPQNFTWEKVPGAKSYNIELFDDGNKKISSKMVKFGPQDQGEPGTQLDIEPPADNTSSKAYTWKVQTCADENGKFCGPLWTSQYFMVKRPGFPQNQIQKKIYGSLGGVELKWTGPTKYYWITINYNKPDPQIQTDCDLKNPIVDKKIDADSCSMQNGCIPSDIKSSCIGAYQWTVQPCANPNCSDRGSDNTLTGYFSVSADATDTNTLSVCGQAFDNPKSEWDETETCEIRHLFLFLKIFIDFLLFRFSIMLLPILVLITGIFFYLGKEGPNTLQYIKDAWKRIGIGYAILFMAWLLTSWLMLAVGYGNIWWKIL